MRLDAIRDVRKAPKPPASNAAPPQTNTGVSTTIATIVTIRAVLVALRGGGCCSTDGDLNGVSVTRSCGVLVGVGALIAILPSPGDAACSANPVTSASQGNNT